MGENARVKLLPEVLSNQIAAGEVVERPASVLKELLENSLDAGATRITIECRAGGASLLRVTDNGSGIHRDDLRLALTRHATSKIDSLEDLESVRSLGFRGEALPSIASVSRLKIDTRRFDDEVALSLTCEAGRLAPEEPSAHPIGTTVAVRDLFFNTPVRRRFLRSEGTELRHLETVVKRCGLARPDVALEFIHNERSVLRLAAARDGDLRPRLARICGREFAEHHIRVESTASTEHGPQAKAAPSIKLSGYLGSPRQRRARQEVQFLFVNGRAVVDPVIRHAVRLAFEQRVGEGEIPAYVLFVELDSTQVDVNVHPTKHEVRFREARMVHDFIRSAIAQALEAGVQRDLLQATESSSPSTSEVEASPRIQQAESTDQDAVDAVRESVPRVAPANERWQSAARDSQPRERPKHGSAHSALTRVAKSYSMADGMPDAMNTAQRVERFDVVAVRKGVEIRDRRAIVVDSFRAELSEQLRQADERSQVLASRPLLLPERLQIDIDAPPAARMRNALDIAGLRLRSSTPALTVLLSVPLVLHDVPAALVARALERLILDDRYSIELRDTLESQLEAVVDALGKAIARGFDLGQIDASARLSAVTSSSGHTVYLSVSDLEQLMSTHGGRRTSQTQPGCGIETDD